MAVDIFLKLDPIKGESLEASKTVAIYPVDVQ